jgi:hypothetical protein
VGKWRAVAGFDPAVGKHRAALAGLGLAIG